MFRRPMNRSVIHKNYLLNALERRVLLSGDLDPTFGFGGLALGSSSSGAPQSYMAVTTTSDRSVIVGGIANDYSGDDNQEYDFFRFNADGSKASFGTQGNSLVSFGSLEAQDGDLNLMVEPDGKIIVAGNLGDTASVNSAALAFGVARLNADGTLDTTFGDNGTLVFQGDMNPHLMWQNGDLLIGSNNTIRRFNDNGTLDSTFPTNLPGGAVFAVQSDEKIVEGFGLSNSITSDTNTEIRRFESNGTLDASFGSNGVAASASGANWVQLTIESGGTIIALLNVDQIYTRSFVLEAFNSNGSIDTAFGSNGLVTAQTSGFDGPYLSTASIVLQPDGQLLVSTSLDSSGFVARYSASGQLDTSFGNGGSTQLDGENESYAFSVNFQSISTLDSAGRLLLVGGANGVNNINGVNNPVSANIVALQTTNAAKPGPAVRLAVVQQPADVFTNQEGTGAGVALEDANGALAVSDTTTFTISLTGGTSGAVLGSGGAANPQAAGGGFDYFGSFYITTPGVGYTLTISSTETPSLTTAPFNVVVPQAFAQQPSGNVQVGMLGPVVVDIYNLEGEIDTTNNSTVFLSIDNNPENATLGGTTQVAAVNGVATFDDLSIATPGTGFILDTGEATSTPFNVVDQHLAFATQPDRVTTAGTLGAVTVDVLDADGNLVTTDNSNVTLALAGGPTSATLGGATTVSAVNGVATFSNLSITTIGNAYTLTASDGGDSPATTTAFNTVPAIVPSNLTPTLGSVRLPSQVVSGTKFTARIPLSITNNANAFKGFVTINVFADADLILDGEQVSVTTLKKKIALKAGKKAYLALTIKSLPSTLSPGTYHLLTQIIDPTGATSLGATSQTITVVAPVIQPVVTAGPVSPLDLSGKRVGAVWITIANEGNVAARGVKIILSPSLDGAAPVAGVVLDSIEINTTIAAGGHRKFKLRFKPSTSLAAGSYYPYATVSLDGILATAVGTTSFTVG